MGGAMGGAAGGGIGGGRVGSDTVFRTCAEMVVTAPEAAHAGVVPVYTICSTETMSAPSEPTAISCGCPTSFGRAASAFPKCCTPGGGLQWHSSDGVVTSDTSQTLTAPTPLSASGTPTRRTLLSSSVTRPNQQPWGNHAAATLSVTNDWRTGGRPAV